VFVGGALIESANSPSDGKLGRISSGPLLMPGSTNPVFPATGPEGAAAKGLGAKAGELELASGTEPMEVGLFGIEGVMLEGN